MAIKKVRIKPPGYTDIIHPETSADVVIESTTKRFVSDTDKANWNAKWDYNEDTIKNVKVNNAVNADTVNGKTVESNVPSNAKFTDTTYSEISTSEIDAGTSSTLRTVSGRRIKYILDKVQGWINALTKADIGLSNVDNVKQASKTEFDEHNNKVQHLSYAIATGTNSYAVNIDGVTSLVEGMSIKAKFQNANTGTATLNINGLGAKEIRKSNGNSLSAGNIKAGQILHLVYTGSVFQLLGEGGEYGTAQASDVLTGKTIGTENGIVTGTMPNRGAINQTLTTQGGSYTIPSGYHNGSGKVTASFANLVAGNIKSGVNIGGVVGTLNALNRHVIFSEGELPPWGIPSQTNPYNFPVYSGYIRIDNTTLVQSNLTIDFTNLNYIVLRVSGNTNGIVRVGDTTVYNGGMGDQIGVIIDIRSISGNHKLGFRKSKSSDGTWRVWTIIAF
jgi:hypothetical protein